MTEIKKHGFTLRQLDEKTDMWSYDDRLLWIVHNKSDDCRSDSVEILAANNMTDIPVIVGYQSNMEAVAALLWIDVLILTLRQWNTQERQVEKWRI